MSSIQFSVGVRALFIFGHGSSLEEALFCEEAISILSDELRVGNLIESVTDIIKSKYLSSSKDVSDD